jgi:hypothetical protein
MRKLYLPQPLLTKERLGEVELQSNFLMMSLRTGLSKAASPSDELKERRLTHFLTSPELVEGPPNLVYPWFDRLTTNGQQSYSQPVRARAPVSPQE